MCILRTDGLLAVKSAPSLNTQAAYLNEECSFWEMLQSDPRRGANSANSSAVDNCEVVPAQRPLRALRCASGSSPLDDIQRNFERSRSAFCREYVERFNGLLWRDHPMRSNRQLSRSLRKTSRQRRKKSSANETDAESASNDADVESSSDDNDDFDPGSIHLIVCVHGLEGSGEDMKLVRVGKTNIIHI